MKKEDSHIIRDKNGHRINYKDELVFDAECSFCRDRRKEKEKKSFHSVFS